MGGSCVSDAGGRSAAGQAEYIARDGRGDDLIQGGRGQEQPTSRHERRHSRCSAVRCNAACKCKRSVQVQVQCGAGGIEVWVWVWVLVWGLKGRGGLGTGGGRRNLVPRSGAERREVGEKSVRALEVQDRQTLVVYGFELREVRRALGWPRVSPKVRETRGPEGK